MMPTTANTETFHIALTGHRPSKLAGYDLAHPFYAALQGWLDRIIDNGLDHHRHLTLHSGMALGADTVWAKSIVAAKRHHPNRIKFVAEVPVLSQPDRWPAARDRELWAELKAQADQVNVYAQTYTVQCLHERNRGMISGADLLLAVWDGSSGGTADGVRIAQARDIRVFRMHPDQVRALLPG